MAMSMFQGESSDSVTTCPRWKRRASSALADDPWIPTITIAASAGLSVLANERICHLTVWVHAPCVNGIEVIFGICAARRDELVTRRLYVPCFVDGTALKQGRSSSPVPGKPEPC